MMYFISILVIGSFIAPTVLFVLYFALAKEIYSLNGLKPGDDYARMLMIGTAIMTSISCAMTPIAHTFPLMAIGYYEAATGLTINWLKYMAIGIPAGPRRYKSQRPPDFCTNKTPICQCSSPFRE